MAQNRENSSILGHFSGQIGWSQQCLIETQEKGQGFARLFTGPKSGGRQTWASKAPEQGQEAEKPLILLVGGAGFEPATPGL